MVDPRPTDRIVRAPMQERSRESWERVLEAGTWILENEGREALTITAVCARAGVAPTAIYRRVDGLAGLFWAIYDRGTAAVIATYDAELAAAAALPPASAGRIDAVVRAVAVTFERHVDFLHPIITYSTSDAALRDRGSRESLELVNRVAALLRTGASEAAQDVARMLHQECTFRSLYGNQWLSADPEDFAAFVARLTRVATSCLPIPG